MPKVTFLLGLAGSGKSHLAEELRRATNAAVLEGVLGPHDPLAVDGPTKRLLEGKDCIVEEIALCFEENRELIVSYLESSVPGVEIAWICFTNDPESAEWNVRHRRNKSDIENHLFINGLARDVQRTRPSSNALVSPTLRAQANSSRSPTPQKAAVSVVSPSVPSEGSALSTGSKDVDWEDLIR